MKVIILAGGLGTRISEETENKPKPMVLLDDKPILWHLMNTYAIQGFTDFVIATGVQYSVRDFVEVAGKKLGIEIRWDGIGVEEKGYDAKNKCIVSVDPLYFRPTEVESLLGDPTKAKKMLGWVPSTTFDELVSEMVKEDLKSAQRDELVKKSGYSIMNYNE